MNGIIKTIGDWAKKYSPQILTGLGIALGIGANVLTAKATVDSVKAVEKIKKDHEPSKREVVKTCWKNYILPATVIAGSAAAEIGACVIQKNRTTAALNMYQSVVDTAIFKTEEGLKSLGTQPMDIQDKNKDHKKNLEHMYSMLKDDQVLVIDLMFGQDPFVSTWNDVVAAKNHVNTLAISDGDEYTINDFNDYLGRPTFRGGDYIVVADDQTKMAVEQVALIINDIPVLGFTYDYKPSKRMY